MCFKSVVFLVETMMIKLRLSFQFNRFVEYKPTSLEKNYKHEMLTEVDLGVNIDLIDPDTYALDPNGEEIMMMIVMMMMIMIMLIVVVMLMMMMMIMLMMPMLMVMVIILKGTPKMRRFSGWLAYIHVRWSLRRLKPHGVPSEKKPLHSNAWQRIFCMQYLSFICVVLHVCCL